MIRVLSLGAGVQSSTLALMIARGELPPVDCAIFSDTGWEPKAVYECPKPPKSSCIGCPFHSDAQWRALTPEEFADAVEVDRAIRHQPGMRAQQFMHKSLKPLDQVDFSTDEERGQLTLFNNECEGLCGV